MNSQKRENLLNLALDATEEERVKSLELDVGYEPIERVWDLIVKYSGSLEAVRTLGAEVTELSNEYAIVTIPESQLERLTGLPQVEYIEKPKRLFFQAENTRRASCITAVQRPPYSLYGEGVLIGIIDSGIDVANPAFQDSSGETRILNLWDQSIPGNPPTGYVIGTEYTKEEIDKGQIPSRDVTGHGTAVAGIATGNGAGSEGNRYAGMAPQSELIVVKMGNPRQDNFPRTTELMQGIDYVLRKAREYERPIAVNISFGNTYGSHNGTSLLERFIDDISNYWKSVICVGSGNEGTSAGHTAGVLAERQEERVGMEVQQNQPAINLQIWKLYVDEIGVSIISPSGVRVGPIQQRLGSQRFILQNTEILLYYGEPSPYSVDQEIFIEFLPRQTYIDSGIWQIVLTPEHIVSGAYQMWLPSQSVLNVGTAFSLPNQNTTLTIPSTASRVITVGAYDALTNTYADFSGRGPARAYENGNIVKPTLVAPGVNVMTNRAGGGYTPVTGTSFAAPVATGAAALLMEWGIVRGNDPYLYGEKVKAYLQRGARQLPGFTEYPNPQVGYGALCVRDSIEL